MQIDRFFVSSERALVKIAKHGGCCLYRRPHARQHVSQEKVSKSDLPKGCNEDVSECFGDLDSTPQIEAVKGLNTDQNERYEKDNGKIAGCRVKFEGELYHSDLPNKTKDPDEGQN